ncbi:MAG: sulfate reduction electron transfer complex DsrMKJOP subunit DsrJ [Bryobacteraceae bacterium]|jgi:hypothetical protein
MSERAIIAAGIALFLAGAGFPFWRNAVELPRPLELRLPQGQRECVRPVAYMRTSHGDLLEDWRDRVVRSGERFFTAPDGRVRELSLVRTCLDCHEKAGFCDRCHQYVAVAPDCWNCHVDPRSPR